MRAAAVTERESAIFELEELRKEREGEMCSRDLYYNGPEN